MKNNYQKHVFPHLLAIAVFLIIASIFSTPLFQGQKLTTHDYSVYQAVSKEKNDYEAEHDRKVLWTNSMFSGMPTYVIATPKQHNIFNKIYHFILFGGFIPFNYIFWYFMGFYIMLQFFRIDPYLSLMGSLFFGLSSYLYIIIAAGHFTKAVALGFMAPIIGGVYVAYKRNMPWAGMMLMAFFLALQILSNHVQIVYYTFIIALVYAIFEFITSLKKKTILKFVKSSAILALGAFIAVAINAAFLITTNEYIPYSQRGPSELSTAVEDRTSGLDRSYAVAWSYGIDETFTLLIPNVKGGSSVSPLSQESETYKVIQRTFGPQTARQIVQRMPVYFGNQPFTSGPVYVGAIVVFLFVFGLMIVKGRIKWWLLAATILSIMLAWGKNFMWFSDLFFDYFPYYNKFRVVAMTLVIAEFTMPLLAVLAVRELIYNKFPKDKILKWFYIALGSTAFICLIYIIAPSIGGVEGDGKDEYVMAREFGSYIDNQQIRQDFERSLVNAFHSDRISVVRKDAARSLFFIFAGAVFIYLLIIKKIKANVAVLAIAFLALIDMAVVNKRYLSEENFSDAARFDRPYEPGEADRFIMQDNNPHFRVLNVAVNTFNDGSTSFFHKSIGGYSAAKLRRYQELFDYVMHDNFAELRALTNAGIQNGFDSQQMQHLIDVRADFPILNMLNTKYFIYHQQRQPVLNNKRYGNAWFVNEHVIVENADREIEYMKKARKREESTGNTIDLSKTAIINKVYESELRDFIHVDDTDAVIELVEYAPDYVIYKSKSKTDQLAVFSEIYYPHGWNVSLNGEQHSHFRANYVLRAMIVPAGEHTIEFRFEPQSYKTGRTISYIASIALILMIVGRIYIERRKTKIKPDEQT